MDLGDGAPVWHVSGSWRGCLGSLEVAEWSPYLRAAMRERLLAALEGVGDVANSYWTPGERVVHLRRKLTADEQAATPAGWCAIPARDLAGGPVLPDWPVP